MFDRFQSSIFIALIRFFFFFFFLFLLRNCSISFFSFFFFKRFKKFLIQIQRLQQTQFRSLQLITFMSASVDLRSLVTRHVHCSTRVFHHAYVTATKLDNCNIIVNCPNTDHSPSSLINLPKFSKLLNFAQKLFNYFSTKRYLTFIVTIRFLSKIFTEKFLILDERTIHSSNISQFLSIS